MVRLLGMMMVCMLLLGFEASAGDNPTLSINAPKQVVAGNSFTVSVEISKGEIEGIARYQLNVPQGISIEPLECTNGDFEFLNQTLKLMWYRIPKTASLKFSFKVVTHTNIKGILNIDGSFVFITPGNTSKNIPAQPVAIEISQSPNADPQTVTDIKNFKPKTTFEDKSLTFVPAIQQMESVKMESKAVRQWPSYDSKTNTFLVSILLDKGSATKYAKLEESIPDGFTAEPVETKGGVFDFKNGKAKFLWLELPQQSRYLVSYRIKPTSAKTDVKNMNITGYFAFINGDNTEIHEVSQLKNNTNLQQLSSEIGNSAAQSSARDIPIKYVGIAKQTSKDAKDQAKTAEPQKSLATTTKTDNPPKGKILDHNSTESVLPGVTFKVQLAAVSKEADKNSADAHFKEFGPIAKEEIGGLVRYLIGPFADYAEALAAKEKAKSKGVEGAFIAPYNSKGVRISINEAFSTEKK